MPTPIQDAYQLVDQTQSQVQQLLSGPEHNRNLLSINTNFRIIKEHLKFMGGILEPQAEQAKTKSRFPPITNFMGKEIKRANVGVEDTAPTDDAKSRFLAKVNKLYNEIVGMNPEVIIKSYTQANDVLVLRGVAIRAGVSDKNDTREITKEFVEEIQFAIIEKAETAEEMEAIDNASKVPKEVEVTADDIAKSTYLKNQKANPGDKFILNPDGKYSKMKVVIAK